MAKKILIIEDDPLMTKLYTDTLSQEKDKYELTHALNGGDGLLKARTIVPDLIFLDIMMPRTNGLEVLDKLKVDPLTKKIPIVVLTNNASEGDQKYALEKGAIKYILKSKFDPQQMLFLVKSII
ncbi:MAG TPA: response regulator [Patescibacteria group bacterium]